MTVANQQVQEVVGQEDVARWITFSGFWGFVFYLLSLLSLITGQRRQPLRLNTRTILAGMAVHVGSFVTIGSLGSLVVSLARGKSTTRQAREQVGTGRMGRTIFQQGLGAAFGSVIPFVWAIVSLRAAERVTGKAAFENSNMNWPLATGAMAFFTGVTALAVSRIAAWVARDARR